MHDEKKKIIDRLSDSHKSRLAKKEKEDLGIYIEYDPEMEFDSKNIEMINSYINQGNYYSQFEEKTRNLSVKVNDRLTKRKKFILSRFAIPIAALIIIVFFIFNKNNNESKTSDLMSIIKPNDIVALTENDNYKELLLATIDNSVTINSELSDSEIEDDINLEIAKSLVDENANEYYSGISEFDLMNNLNNIDENEFQKILKDIENAKIIE